MARELFLIGVKVRKSIGLARKFRNSIKDLDLW